MLKFSIKNAFRKKTIAILASIGVGFGLMLVFVLGAFSAGVTAQFQDNLSKTVGQVQITEKLKTGYESKIPLNFTDQLYETERVGEHIVRYNVEVESPLYFTLKYFGNLKNDADRLILKGVNSTLDTEWEGPTTKLEQGRLFREDRNELIVDSRLLDITGFNAEIGEEIEIYLNLGGTESKNLTIVGIYSQEDNGAPEFVPRDYYLYTDLSTIWDLLDEAEEESNVYSSILLSFDAQNNNETKKYVEIINEESENGLYDPLFVNAFTLGALFEAVEETFGIIDAFTSVIGLITTIAGGMAIIVTQLLSVSSRMKEFAILKSTGWKNRHIFLNVIYESLTLGLLGAAIGLGLGSLLIFFISGEASPLGSITAIITIDGLVEVVAYALGLGILGGLYPGIKAARVRPVVVLKGG